MVVYSAENHAAIGNRQVRKTCSRDAKKHGSNCQQTYRIGSYFMDIGSYFYNDANDCEIGNELAKSEKLCLHSRQP